MTDAPAPPVEDGTPPPDASTPPPAAPSATTRPPFRRTAGDRRVIAGVAGGVARTFGLDPVLVRIGFVVVAVVAFPLVLGYAAAWLLAPEDGSATAEVDRPRGVGWWIGLGLGVIGILALADTVGGGGSPLVALALVGIGVALWNRPTTSAASAPVSWPVAGPAPGDGPTAARGTGGTTTVATPVTPEAGSDTPAGAGGGRGDGGPPLAPEPVWTPPPARPRERSSLGPLTLGLALVAAGVTVALDTAGTIQVDVTQVFAVALAVIGAGLLVGTWLGRARWLSLIALVLLPPVLIGSAVRGLEDVGDLDISIIDQIGAGIGERTVDIDDAADLERLDGDVDLGIGSLTVDLTDFVGDDDATLMIDQGIGELIVLLPTDARFIVDATVAAGELEVRTPDALVSRSGTQIDVSPFDTDTEGRSTTLSGGPASGPRLDIDVELGLGELTLVTDDTTEDLR